ncbi:MAG: hypothetical protein V9G13_12580 [Marmoricola sp.]
MRRPLAVLLAPLLCVGVLAAPGAQAAKRNPGDLDTGFGTQGTRLSALWSTGDDVTGVTKLSEDEDDALIVSGSTKRNDAAGDPHLELSKFGSNGTNGNFGNFGRATMMRQKGAVANAVTTQANDRVVSAGYMRPASGGKQFFVARHTIDTEHYPGWADYSFGTAGGVETQVGGDNDAEAMGVAMTPDQRIVAGGRAKVSGSNAFGVVRYLSNGTVDSSFGSANGVTTDFGSDDLARAIAVQPDGKVMAAGKSGSKVAVARYQTNGVLDPSFGSGGKVAFAVGDSVEARAMSLLPDGRIVLAGVINQGGRENTFVARLMSNGAFDPSFGAGGKVVVSLSGGNDAANAVAVQPNGQVLTGGYADSGTTRDFAVARFNPNGSLDIGFGLGGSVYTSFGQYGEEATAMLLQRDGKIVLAGWARKADGTKSIALARYHSDQPLASIAFPARQVKRKNFRAISGSVTGANVTSAGVAIQKLNRKLQRRGICQWMMPAGFVFRTKAYTDSRGKKVCKPTRWYEPKTWSKSGGVGYYSLKINPFKAGLYEISVRGVADKVNQETPTTKRVRVVR